MCRRIIFIPTTLASVFKQFINIGDLTGHLFMIVVGLSVLEDELGIEELLIDVLRGIVPAADDEDFGRNES
jgi:hypothetical protein